MFLRLIGSIILLVSVITGIAVAGLSLMGVETNIHLPRMMSPSVSSIDGMLAIAMSYGSLIPARGDTPDLDVYRYRVIYNFTAPSQSAPKIRPVPSPITVTSVTPAPSGGNTTVTIVTQTIINIPMGQPGIPVEGYNIVECRLYIVTGQELQSLAANPALQSRLQSGLPMIANPTQFSTHLKLLESVTPHFYKARATGNSCFIEATVDSKPAYVMVIQIVDPSNLKIDMGSVYISGEDIMRYIKDPSPENELKEVNASGAPIAVPITAAIHDLITSLELKPDSYPAVKAKLQASTMSIWRLASIAAVGLILTRLDRGERGELLPRALRRLARKLGGGRE